MLTASDKVQRMRDLNGGVSHMRLSLGFSNVAGKFKRRARLRMEAEKSAKRLPTATSDFAEPSRAGRPRGKLSYLSRGGPLGRSLILLKVPHGVARCAAEMRPARNHPVNLALIFGTRKSYCNPLLMSHAKTAWPKATRAREHRAEPAKISIEN